MQGTRLYDKYQEDNEPVAQSQAERLGLVPSAKEQATVKQRQQEERDYVLGMWEDLAVAETILQQLGGVTFKLFTGAKNFVHGDRELNFSIGRNSKRVNKVRIKLQGDDTYTMTFFRVTKRGLNVTVMAEVAGVYAESLRRVFELHTELLTGMRTA